ncbi:hypothetical protein T440DRAFT_465000 [Plenodomus tracheiphilus IPT5]|uniref:Uncharacterized protein n=1 Tax=Plenodomus tracheiphilus IPT5 TaxID=1408161 RepID=A0A6A7BHF5_9PLEO|nr:hypothetical protein T440DRAFT_465000 [Plenodomus tracheiphilus IPT5]
MWSRKKNELSLQTTMLRGIRRPMSSKFTFARIYCFKLYHDNDTMTVRQVAILAATDDQTIHISTNIINATPPSHPTATSSSLHNPTEPKRAQAHTTLDSYPHCTPPTAHAPTDSCHNHSHDPPFTPLHPPAMPSHHITAQYITQGASVHRTEPNSQNPTQCNPPPSPAQTHARLDRQ